MSRKKHPIFKSISVVDGGDSWKYDYVFRTEAVKTETKKAESETKKLKPEGKYLKGKKHGVEWTEGPATAKSLKKPQGQWSLADLEFASEKASTLEPGKSDTFDLPAGKYQCRPSAGRNNSSGKAYLGKE